MYKETPIRLSADLSAKTLQARTEWQDIFKILKDKTYNLGYSNCQGYNSEFERLSQTKAKGVHHQ